MSYKFCPQCENKLSVGKFGKNKNKSDGLQNYCKECRKLQHSDNRDKILAYQKEYRQQNLESLREKEKAYHWNNRTFCNERSRQYYQKNKQRLSQENKEYYKRNKDYILNLNWAWRKRNADKKRKIDRDYRHRNKQWCKIKNQIWKNQNVEYLRKYFRERERTLRKTNVTYNLNHRISVAINESLKRGKGKRSWQELVGYTVGELKERLFSTMPQGYTWEDFLQGRLHIDHIIPKSHFQFEGIEDGQFKQCWALENLQLLPASVNLSKSNKLLVGREKTT